MGCPETSVRNYHYPLHNNPQEFCPIFRVQESKRIWILEPEDGTDTLSRNVVNKLLLLAA